MEPYAELGMVCRANSGIPFEDVITEFVFAASYFVEPDHLSNIQLPSSTDNELQNADRFMSLRDEQIYHRGRRYNQKGKNITPIFQRWNDGVVGFSID